MPFRISDPVLVLFLDSNLRTAKRRPVSIHLVMRPNRFKKNRRFAAVLRE